MKPEPTEGEGGGEERDPFQEERRRLFGERLQERRTARGWSQETLARHMGGTQSRVSRWESGEVTPERDTIRRIEEALEVDPGSFLHLLGYAPATPVATVSVEEAILADPDLDETGRQVLLAAYKAARKATRQRR